MTISKFPYKGLLSVGLLLLAGPLLAQINTESMRKNQLDPGSHFTLGADLSFIQGNSTIFQSRLKARYDHVFERGRYFLIGNHKVSSKDDQIFINQGFSHLRIVRNMKPLLKSEFFIQQEYNEFINLQSRSLAGVGFRYIGDKQDADPLSLIVGMGLMIEREKMDAGPTNDLGDPVHGDLAELLRSSNYLVLNWRPTPNFSLNSTSYYQVDTQRLADFRMLSQSSAVMALTKRLSLEMTLDVRYDSEPPVNIENLDMEFSQGLSYTFK